MGIYTRNGDKGKTHLIGGEQVHKHDQRVIAYGTIDELNSFIGLAIAHLSEQEHVAKDFHQLQHLLFCCGADLATPQGTQAQSHIKKQHVEWLEEKIDHYTSLLVPIRHFILPGGSIAASYLHVARTVARRAEREITAVTRYEVINPIVLPFVNRLSDYLFTMARYANQTCGMPEHQYPSSLGS